MSLRGHGDLLRAKPKRHQGYEFKVVGDGFVLAFQKAI
jgi:hypothetical protein